MICFLILQLLFHLVDGYSNDVVWVPPRKVSTLHLRGTRLVWDEPELSYSLAYDADGPLNEYTLWHDDFDYRTC